MNWVTMYVLGGVMASEFRTYIQSMPLSHVPLYSRDGAASERTKKSQKIENAVSTLVEKGG
jgi:hypothetical protein